MRVFVAGASGVLGRALLPALTAAGHEVIGLVRSGAAGRTVAALGVRVEQADAMDRSAVRRSMRRTRPDAVVDLLTAIPAEIYPKRMARDFAQTNRLRTEGTGILLDAAEETGAQRIITEGLAYVYDPDGPGLADEDSAFWPRPPAQFAPNVAALIELEQRTRQANGLVVRLGHLYGPGSIYATDGSFTSQVRSGKLALVGGGTSVFSFIHAHDAATAITAALQRDIGGALNIVDDDPAPMSEWLPLLADLVGARPPRNVPKALARIVSGSWGVTYMTRLRGASNDRARRRLGWEPSYSSWRAGFAAELATAADAGSGRTAPSGQPDVGSAKLG
jgi:nucleoside-diphosphate-sugar epimerase